MSDEATSPAPNAGSLSPRNTDTVVYRVLKELPIAGIAPVGKVFSSWPQGEVFACVSGVGLGPVRNSDVALWEESGLIVREKPLTPAQERALMAEGRGKASDRPENASGPLATAAGHPWAFPDSAGAGGKA